MGIGVRWALASNLAQGGREMDIGVSVASQKRSRLLRGNCVIRHPFLSSPSSVAGAVGVDASEFRTLDASLSLIRPPVTRDYQAWSPAERKARDGKLRHEWRSEVRFGPNASGELARRIHNLDAAPSGIR